ncbi:MULTISPECIES: MATE family efflux transporter [unclassified Exiguobacterium]|uniref:MATE family efflux transporter n=1 Tax=unclassified Exiguobacterium TaxID=2644629 RepID=UPI0025BA7BE7|nr:MULTISPECIES: MATE family efflux transporter [unclassified Exiguobacterium]
MLETVTFSGKMKQFMKIFFPILVTQVAFYLISFFDTVMAGRYGSADLAGVGVGASLWAPVYTGLTGILLAVAPLVSQAMGAKREREVKRIVMQALYVAVVIIGLTVVIGLLAVNPILERMELSVEAREVARNYLVMLALGIVPMFVFFVLRTLIDSLGKSNITMVLLLISLPINVLFNYLFIFGNFGFPELGGVGAGVATAITYWILCLAIIAVVMKGELFQRLGVLRRFYRPDMKRIKELILLGAPIGLAIFSEVSIFSAVTLLLGAYGDVIIGAYQAAINFASFVYMIPLSAASALTITVGFEVGAKRIKDAVQYVGIGLTMCVAVSVFSGILLYLKNEELAALYSRDPKVIEAAAHFMILAIFFQLSDAVAAPTQGALRGFKDVNVTFLLTIVAYWVIGLPLGFYLERYTALGPDGYWWGLIIGLAVGATLLLVRLMYLIRKSRRLAS